MRTQDRELVGAERQRQLAAGAERDGRTVQMADELLELGGRPVRAGQLQQAKAPVCGRMAAGGARKVSPSLAAAQGARKVSPSLAAAQGKSLPHLQQRPRPAPRLCGRRRSRRFRVVAALRLGGLDTWRRRWFHAGWRPLTVGWGKSTVQERSGTAAGGGCRLAVGETVILLTLPLHAY